MTFHNFLSPRHRHFSSFSVNDCPIKRNRYKINASSLKETIISYDKIYYFTKMSMNDVA